MRLLLIHTAGGEGSVALADTEACAGDCCDGGVAGEDFFGAAGAGGAAVDGGAGWRLSELAAVVVVHGPGSFTGVRVGLSAAKGLSEAGGVPLIAVSRLALLAAALMERGAGACGAGCGAGGVLLRGVCWGGGVCGRPCCRGGCAGCGCGRGCGGVRGEGGGGSWRGWDRGLVQEPSAGDALPFALERIAAGDFDDAATLDANYLRRTDAEIFAKPAAPRAAK